MPSPSAQTGHTQEALRCGGFITDCTDPKLTDKHAHFRVKIQIWGTATQSDKSWSSGNSRLIVMDYYIKGLVLNVVEKSWNHEDFYFWYNYSS